MCLPVQWLCLVQLCDPLDYSPPASTVGRNFQARRLEGTAISTYRDLPDPGIEHVSPAGEFFTTKPRGKPLAGRPGKFDHCQITVRKNVLIEKRLSSLEKITS